MSTFYKLFIYSVKFTPEVGGREGRGLDGKEINMKAQATQLHEGWAKQGFLFPFSAFIL
jgi:hypothetical protein